MQLLHQLLQHLREHIGEGATAVYAEVELSTHLGRRALLVPCQLSAEWM